MSSLVEACRSGRLPDLNTLIDYGMDGRDGVNPIALFDIYRKLVLENRITADELHHAMVMDTLSTVAGIKIKSGYNKSDDAIFNY